MLETTTGHEQDDIRAGGKPHEVLPVAGNGLIVERNRRRLLDDVTISFGGSGITVVMGPNGAGKSLLLRVMANLLEPDGGEVRWAGTAPDRTRATRIGFVFQKPIMLRRSVLQNIKYALTAAHVARSKREQQARELLTWASLDDLAHSPARVLSGGEQQRLAVVRALATRPEILLLDEPTSSLDPASTLAIERLLGESGTRNTKVVLITHDVGQAHRLADEIVFLHRGQITEQVPAKEFFEAPASAPARAFIEGQIVL
jgi:tungstate transport system ATP-binding protein